MTAGAELEAELAELLERAPEEEWGRAFGPDYWARLDGVRAELRALEWWPVRHRSVGALEAELLEPTRTLVPAGELRAGMLVEWGPTPFHAAGSATVRSVETSSRPAAGCSDRVRVNLCAPHADWLECSARHRLEVVNVD